MRTAFVLFLVFLTPATVWADFDKEPFLPFENKTITQITFNGNRATRDFVIARELDLEEGQPLDVAELEEGYQHLENLGIFGSIEIEAKEDGEGVALDFQFREMPALIPYVAFRYTEENGFSVGPALSSVNLFGRAIRVSGRVLFGGTTTAVLMLKYPWITGDYRLSLDLDASHLVRDDKLNEFEETSDEITPWIGRYLGENGRLRGMVGYFRMEADKDGITLDDDRSDNFFRAGARVGYDSRDSWRDPARGWQNELEVLTYVGDGNFVETTIDIRRFQPITANERHKLFIGVLTSLRTGTVGVDVPTYLQYRMGGANSIRGYNIDVLGKELFGKNQLITTLEYQITLLPLQAYNFFRWSAALGLQLAFFVDRGNAWSTNDEFKRDRGRTGYGVGLRLLIPGSEQTRFDLGVNPNGDVYFHFGSWFKWTAQRFRLR